MGVIGCSLVSIVINPVLYSKALQYVLSQKDNWQCTDLLFVKAIHALNIRRRPSTLPQTRTPPSGLTAESGEMKPRRDMTCGTIQLAPSDGFPYTLIPASAIFLQLAPRVYRVSAKIFTSTLASLMNDFYSLGGHLTASFLSVAFLALLVDFLPTAFLVMDRSTKVKKNCSNQLLIE